MNRTLDLYMAGSDDVFNYTFYIVLSKQSSAGLSANGASSNNIWSSFAGSAFHLALMAVIYLPA